MPVGPIKTKAQKQAVVHTEMSKFKHGTLHSGSKRGPKVKSRAQAVAIAMSESGQSKKHTPSIGKGESKPGYDRSSHHKGNPGFAEGRHKPNQTYQQELHEHWGSKVKGPAMGNKKPFGHIDADRRGSALVENCGEGHAKQPHGSSGGSAGAGREHNSSLAEKSSIGHAKQGKGNGIGITDNDRSAEHRQPLGHAFNYRQSPGSHGYGHSAAQRSGVHRLSGHSGAHRVGRR